jgi:hypothetical protein
VRVSPVRKRMMVYMEKIVRTERLDQMKKIVQDASFVCREINIIWWWGLEYYRGDRSGVDKGNGVVEYLYLRRALRLEYRNEYIW